MVRVSDNKNSLTFSKDGLMITPTQRTNGVDNMTAQARTFICNGRTIELIGATTNMQIWIDGKLYRQGVNGLRTARLSAFSYCERHATK